jgi:hypothetical protein
VSLLENAELTFLSFVVPSRIPLYLVAGRSLDVWTDNEATESWFRDFLLHSPDRSGRDRGEEEDKYTAWWDTHRCQSDVGALLRVRDRSGSADSNPKAPGPKITEVLLYGTLLEAQNARQLPTPPSSSSPVPLALGDGDAASGALTASVMKQLTVHALLLSSELAYSEAQAVITTTKPSAGGPATVEAIPSARGGSETVDAQFLPPLFQDKKHGNHPSLKRRRAETLFEDATNKVRKARRGGGKRVSQIMVDVTSSGSGAFPPLPPATQAVTNKAETQNLGPEYPVNAEGKLANSRGPPREGSVCTRPQSSDAQLSWSAATRPGSPPIPNVVRSKEGKETGQTRIASRRNTLNSITRPSPSLSSNTATTVDGNCQNSLAEVVLEPRSLPEAQKTIEMRNKELLSRIVMAGMRIYGLQQQKKTSKFRDVPEGSALNGSHTPLETDEYKLVYHQTFKGACFAFVSAYYLFLSLLSPIVLYCTLGNVLITRDYLVCK